MLLRHTIVYQRSRKQKKMRGGGTQVCYLLVPQSCQIQPSVFPKLLSRFSTKFLYFLPYMYTTSHIKIEGNRFSSS